MGGRNPHKVEINLDEADHAPIEPSNEKESVIATPERADDKETKEKPTPKHVATVEISDDKVEARSVSTVNIDEYASGDSENVKEVQSIDTLKQEKVSETSNAEEVSSVQQETKSVSKIETLSANQGTSAEQDSASKSVSKISIDERVVQSIKDEEKENAETLSVEQTSSTTLTKSANEVSLGESTSGEVKESTITETSTSVKASSSKSLAASSTEREGEEKSVSKITVEHLTTESSKAVTETTKSEETNVAKESTNAIEHITASKEDGTSQQKDFDNISKIQVDDKVKETETLEEKHISSISVDSENQQKQFPFPATKTPQVSASPPAKHITTVPLGDEAEPVAEKPDGSKGDGKSQVQKTIAAFMGTAPSTTLSDKKLSDEAPMVNGAADDVNDDEDKLNDKEANEADLSPTPTKPHTIKKPFEMEAIKEEESPLPNGHVPNDDISERDINDNVKNTTSETNPLKNNHLAVSPRSSITL